MFFLNLNREITVDEDRITTTYRWEIVKETQKAVLVRETMTITRKRTGASQTDTKEAWLPKSALAEARDGWFAVADWALAGKGLHPVTFRPYPPEYRPEEMKAWGTAESPMTAEQIIRLYEAGLAEIA